MLNRQLMDEVRDCAKNALNGKDLYLIGYPDIWRFETKERIGEYSNNNPSIYNSFWSVEYPKQTKKVLIKYSQHDESSYDELMEELDNPDYLLHLGVRENICEILYFKPYLMVPCSGSEGEKRDEDLTECLMKHLLCVSENYEFNDYNSIISFMGYTHTKYVMELNKKENFLQGLNVKIKIFR